MKKSMINTVYIVIVTHCFVEFKDLAIKDTPSNTFRTKKTHTGHTDVSHTHKSLKKLNPLPAIFSDITKPIPPKPPPTQTNVFCQDFVRGTKVVQR